MYSIPLDVAMSNFPLFSLAELSENPELIEQSLSSITNKLKSIAHNNLPIKRFRKHRVLNWSNDLKAAHKNPNVVISRG